MTSSIDKPNWIPSRKGKTYRDNFSKIRWNAKSSISVVTQRGKAKSESTASRLLNARETVEAVRTPLGQRTDRTFRHLN